MAINYARKLRVFGTDGTTVDDSVYTGGWIDDAVNIGCTNARIRGCVEASFETVRASTVRDGVKIARDQIVRIYDANDLLIFTGYVSHIELSVDGMRHRYQLRGLYDRLRDAEITTAIRLGASTEQSATASTVGEIVDYVISTYVDGQVDGVTYDASLISCNVEIQEKLIAKDQSIDDLLQELHKAAQSDGDIYTYGVRPDGKFFFHAISTDPGDQIDTATVGTDVLRAVEIPADLSAVNQVRLIGDLAEKGENGGHYRTNRQYRHSSAPDTVHASYIMPIRVIGWTREADFKKIADGIFQEKARPSYRVEGAGRLARSAFAAIPFPWNGQMVYTDTVRGTVATAYVNSIRYELNEAFILSPTLGVDDAAQQADGIVDKFTTPLGAGPSYTGSPYYTDMVEAQEQGEFSLGSDGVAGVDEILDGRPGQWTADEIESIASGAGGGGGGDSDIDGPNEGEVLELTMSPANPEINTAEIHGDTVYFWIKVARGGDGDQFDAAPDASVTVYCRQYDAHPNDHPTAPGEPRTLIKSGELLASRQSSDGETDSFFTETGFELSASAPGWLLVTVRVQISSGPATYRWWPINIDQLATAKEKFLAFKVTDQLPASSGGADLTFVVGWPDA